MKIIVATLIGIACHLLYHEDDGELFRLDVDVNPPTPHVKNIKDYSGSNRAKREWLEKNRHWLIYWLPEWRKSLDMSAAALGAKRSIRFRKINRNKVIPEQLSIVSTLLRMWSKLIAPLDIFIITVHFSGNSAGKCEP